MTSSSPAASVASQVVGLDQQGSLKMEQTEMAASLPVQPVVTVAPADQVLTLVSSSVINQRGFANTCGVPLGAHLELQPPAALRLPRVAQRAPLRCNGCSAFLNVYCKTNLPKGVWKCNMCGGVNIHKEQLGTLTDVASMPELCSEAVEYVAPLPPRGPLAAPDQPPPPHLVFAVDTSLEPADLQAVRSALLDLLTGPDLPPTTLVSLLTFDGCVAVHSLAPNQRCSHVLPTAGLTAGIPTVNSSGGSGSSAASLDLQSAVHRLLERHCAATAARRAGGKGGADGQQGAAASASGGVLVSELSACCGSALPKALSSLRTVQSDVAVRSRARCLLSAVEVALRLIAAHASLDLTRHHNLYGSRVVVLAGGPPTRGPGALPLELLDQAIPEKGRAPENRSLAAALDFGVALGELGAKLGVPVDIFTSCPTGFNARLLTAIAHGSGGELMPQLMPSPAQPTHTHPPPPSPSPSSPTATPPSVPSTPRHQTTPNPTMTTTTPNPTPTTTTNQDASTSQHGSATATATATATASGGTGTAAGTAVAAGSGGSGGGFLGPLLFRQLAAALSRRFGVGGRLDCFCSEGLRLVQWLGPLDPLREEAEEPRAAAAAAARDPAGGTAGSGGGAGGGGEGGGGGGGGGGDGGAYRLSAAACCVAAVEAGRCASLRLEVTRELDDVPSLVLQVALHWLEPSARCRVVRVVTRRLAVVESRAEFLRTVNPTAAAALLGKRAALEAKKAGAFRDSRKAEEARYAVAAQLGLVASRCGQEVQTRRGVLGLGASRSNQWPPELMPLAYALYHFQRGPLLGPPPPSPPQAGGAAPLAAAHPHSLWDSDARLVGLNTLLRAAWADAYRVMAPKLYAVLPPPAVGAAAAAAAEAAVPPPPPQLVALPCVTLAAVMARTAPLLLDVGTAVLVSPTEEPGHGQHPHPDGAVEELPPSLLAAALQAVALTSLSTSSVTSSIPTSPFSLASSASVAAAAAAGRFPVPCVALAPGAQAGGGALAARLIPVHRDAYEEQALQHPQLQQLGQAVAAQLSKQLAEGAEAAAAAAARGLPPAAAKQAAAAAGASFVEWCRGVNVRPFPVAAGTS